VNDVYLRAYRNCPKFTKNLQKLYATNGWKDLETSSESLLKKLAEKFPDWGGNVTDNKVLLTDVWNYYDPIHVARTECNPHPGSYTCLNLIEDPSIRKELTDVEFSELEVLMEQTEQLKFGIATAKNLLGSNLLWEILNRVPKDGRFFLYSAHAPTMMGFFSALKQWNIDERYIDYGSAVIIEVYEDSYQRYSIRLLYKAASKNEARYLPLSNIDCQFKADIALSDDDNERCPYEDVKLWAERNTIYSVEGWCEACENDSADVCLQHFKTSWAIFEDRTNTTELDILLAVFFGGFFAGFLLMLLCCQCCRTASRGEADGLYKEEESYNDDDDVDDELSLSSKDEEDTDGIVA
jgi:hypothetical protein